MSDLKLEWAVRPPNNFLPDHAIAWTPIWSLLITWDLSQEDWQSTIKIVKPAFFQDKSFNSIKEAQFFLEDQLRKRCQKIIEVLGNG